MPLKGRPFSYHKSIKKVTVASRQMANATSTTVELISRGQTPRLCLAETATPDFNVVCSHAELYVVGRLAFILNTSGTIIFLLSLSSHGGISFHQFRATSKVKPQKPGDPPSVIKRIQRESNKVNTASHPNRCYIGTIIKLYSFVKKKKKIFASDACLHL